ncbi:MAG: hypothetical protein FWC69_00975 [Defluviitaleaceae bacterium]|nr:hypothetical protein [Defluviitaleaceae bacterium]
MYLKDKNDYKKLQKEASKEIGIWSLWLIPSFVVVATVAFMVINIRYPLTLDDLQTKAEQPRIVAHREFDDAFIYMLPIDENLYRVNIYSSSRRLQRFRFNNSFTTPPGNLLFDDKGFTSPIFFTVYNSSNFATFHLILFHLHTTSLLYVIHRKIRKKGRHTNEYRS